LKPGLPTTPEIKDCQTLWHTKPINVNLNFTSSSSEQDETED
jgi:hypothetical protein